MQRRSGPAVFLKIEVLREREHVGDRGAGPIAERPQALDVGLGHENLVGQIEGHRDRDPAAQDHVGSLRVDVDIELGRRADVAHLEIGAAHHHDLPDTLGDAGRLHERHRDVGQRAERAG